MKSWLVLPAAAAVFSAAAMRSPQASEGRELYGRYCAACHGATGTPTRMALAQWPQIPALSAPAFLEARSSDSIVTVAHNGVDKDMPARKGQLTREQIVAIAQYVRSLVPPKSP